MTRFIGVTALPATSGMSWSCVGVWGSITLAARDLRTFLPTGVAEALSELRCCSANAPRRRFAFSSSSSLSGILEAVSEASQPIQHRAHLMPFAGVA